MPLFEIGFFGDLALSGLFGGGALAYASLRKDAVGDVASKVGSLSLKATDKAAELNEEYEVTEKLKQKASDALSKLTTELKKKL